MEDLFEWSIKEKENNIIEEKINDDDIVIEKQETEEKDLFGNKIIKDILLRDKFIEPPFSILDTKTGEWQNRKRKWLGIGIKSEIGRDETNVLPNTEKCDYMPDMKSTTSIFDPALCELMYKWFCPENGNILDPFAGGSVRGIVAHYLGYKYSGIELRQEQVDSNREQALAILPFNNQPRWYVGDSDKALDDQWQFEFDFIFSCPPYMNLEKYSDLPDDLSNMPDKKFMEKYYSIINKAIVKLKRGAFACFIVGDVRDDKGYYKDFLTLTKCGFYQAGLKLWNDAILADNIGTAMIRAENAFVRGNKKLVKIHQNILIFKKPLELK